MRFFWMILFTAFLAVGCAFKKSHSQTNYNLSASDFAAKIKDNPSASILDVRTPEEYEEGFIKGAVNYNWNDETFGRHIATLDIAKPVLVYCLVGGRSSDAAEFLRQRGFKEVYELDGGMLSWRKAELPEVRLNQSNEAGLTMEDYNKLVVSDKLVLVDYYAEWCGPCKKMKPFLKEIESEMSETVQLVTINIDQNKTLAKQLNINAIPVLEIYKSGKKVWSNMGSISKKEVVKALNKAL